MQINALPDLFSNNSKINQSVPEITLPRETIKLPVTESVIKLNALIKGPLIDDSKLKNNEIRLLSESYKQNLIKIKAFIETAFSENAITKKDEEHLENFDKNLVYLKNQMYALKRSNQISTEQLNASNEHIQQARSILEETRLLIKMQQHYQKRADEFDDLLAKLVDLSYEPVQGDPLKTLGILEDLLHSALKLGKFVKPSLDKKEESLAASKLSDLCQSDLRHLSWVIEDWCEAVETDAKGEIKELADWLKLHPDDENGLRQLKALEHHLNETSEGIKNQRKIIAKLQEKVPQFHSELKSIDNSLKQASQALKQENSVTEIPELTYGDSQWNELKAERKEQLQAKQRVPFWIEKKIGETLDFIGHPEDWSQGTKNFVFCVFTAMQISQQVLGTTPLDQRSQMMAKLAEMLHRQAMPPLPEEVILKINQEGKLIEELLSDPQKYEEIHQSDILIEITEKHPSVRQALEYALENLPDDSPNDQQVDELVYAHIANRVFSEAYENLHHHPMKNPFESLSFYEWWTLFTTDAIDKNQTNTTPLIAPFSSDCLKDEGMMQTIIKRLGSLFGQSTPLGTAEIETETFEKLKEAAQSAESAVDELIETPELISLREEATLLHRELLKSMATTPAPICPLIDLAKWVQISNEHCYSLKILEKRIQILKDKTDLTLASQDQELENFGEKHKNIIKQSKLIKLLEIPGVSVPVPQGLSSDSVYSFLLSKSPEIFDYWKQLHDLYLQYKGNGPFLESSSAASLLRKIEKSIEYAFSSRNVFEYLNFPTGFENWLDTVKDANEYLMVRSSGAEDSKKTANAGGNVSKAYVQPDKKSVCEAVGAVVKSYFSFSSLQNQINAKLNPFEGSPKLGVSIQELIGEPIGGTKNATNIPISIVLFSNEPLYIGKEKFRVMRITAGYGHGDAVVGHKGIPTDTVLILNSEFDPNKLYFLYDNKEKPERLAPIHSEEGVVLGNVKNPPSIKNQPTLSKEMIAKLYHWALMNEIFFGYPVDMELVAQNNVIHSVQGRPVNRPDLLPTFFDPRKLSAPSSLIQRLHGDVIVSGTASASILTNPEELLYAETLEEAERKFSKNQHKIVVVSAEEPPNSHPVVNFSGLGIPCLYQKDGQEVERLKEKISEKLPLVVCVQTATLNLVDGSHVDHLISKGFVSHPAKTATSLPLSEEISQLDKHYQDLPEKVKELRQELQSVTSSDVALRKLNEIHEQTTQELEEAEKQLEERIWKSKYVPKEAIIGLEAIKQLSKQFQIASNEAKEALHKLDIGQELEPLFHAKVLHSLFAPDVDQGAIGRFSVLDVKSIQKAANALISYQEQLKKPALFADLLLDGSKTPNGEIFKQWEQFLVGLETLGHQKKYAKDIKRFRELMHTLKKTGALSGWLIQSFAPFEGNSLETLQKHLKAFSPSDEKFIQKLEQAKGSLDRLENQISLFGDPQTVEQVWKEFKEETDVLFPLSNKPGNPFAYLLSFVGLKSEKLNSFADEMNHGSDLTKLIAIPTITKLIDLFDLSIKTVLASTKFDETEKVVVFKKMIDQFFLLLKGFQLHINHELLTRPHELEPTLDTMEFVEEVETILNRISPTTEHLKFSEKFSVLSAVYGNWANFKINRPSSLQDIFTFTHQVLLAVSSRFTQQLFQDKTSLFPSPLQDAMKIIEDSRRGGSAGQMMGVRLSENDLILRYNIPYGEHSGTVELIYNRLTNDFIFKGFLLGVNEHSRWDSAVEFLTIFSELGILSLEGPVKLGEMEVAFSWRLSDMKSFKLAVDMFNKMGFLRYEGKYYYYLEGIFAKEGKQDLLENYLLNEHFIRHSSFDDYFNSLQISVAESFIKEYLNKISSKELTIEERQQIFETAKRLSPSNFSLRIYAELVKYGENLDQMVDTAKIALLNNRNDEFALNLFERLFEKGKGIQEAFEMINHNLLKDNSKIEHLLISLMKYGHGYKEALAFAKKNLFHPIEFNAGKSMFIHLIQTNQCIKEIIDVGVEGCNSPDKRAYALELLMLLMYYGHGYREAKNVAKKIIAEGNCDGTNCEGLINWLKKLGQWP